MTTQNDAAKDNQEFLKKEYEIIQSKIDKIGESKLKIRGWSLTFLTAAIAGLISKESGSVLWVASSLIPISFHGLEYEQEILSRALGKRAKNIEYLFFLLQHNDNSRRSKIQLKKALQVVISTPRIASEMGNARPRELDVNILLDIRNNLFFYVQLLIILLIYNFHN